ncbi:MAG: GrpB family protein [Bacteroidota bacterium]
MDEIGLVRGTIRLVPHQASWKGIFEAEREKLAFALADSILKIEHIGSTAIPGIAAKPIIDMAITLVQFEDGLDCVAALEDYGYLYKGENGIPGRHYFRTDAEIVKFHIHMFAQGNPKLRDHQLFRDYLIAQPEEAQAYHELKIKLSQQFATDRGAYTASKNDFISDILTKARASD